MKKYFIKSTFYFIVLTLVGFSCVVWSSKVVNANEIVYLENEYIVELSSYSRVWVTYECDEGECGYWDYQSGTNTASTVGHDETLSADFGRFYYYGIVAPDVDCASSYDNSELFYLPDGQSETREAVAHNEDGYFEWIGEGVYEVDVHRECNYLMYDDPQESDILAWLRPKVAHAEDVVEGYIGTIRFTVAEEGACTADCFSNVLFLPGLQASRLYIDEGGNENQLWEPNRYLDVEKLYLNTDGTSINPDIYTKDIISETNTPVGAGFFGQNIYKSFAKMMGELMDDFLISVWAPYAYDWRDSVDDIVNNGTKYEGENKSLIATLEELAENSKSGKVTIISHSNGGLLAKALLKKLQDDKDNGLSDLIEKVDVLILVGVPQIGTAKAVPSILHGYDQSMLKGLLMDNMHARELGRNMPSAYGLLPSREYINRVSTSPATFIDNPIPSNITTAMVQTYGGAIDSYQEYKDFLFGVEGRVGPDTNQVNLPINLSNDLFSEAEILHNEIDSWIPPDGLRVIEVAGWGLETLASFEYYPKRYCVAQNSSCGYSLDQRPKFTVDGDGTVVVPSAQYIGSDLDTEKYWVDLPRYNRFFNFTVDRDHKNILEINSINGLIENVLLGEDIVLDDVIKDSQPIDASDRLRLSIHSPVEINAYDEDGNHTGKVCPPTSDFCFIEENIPNSSYMEFGEGKYLNLPEDKAKSIKLRGTGTGTFTYISEKAASSGPSEVSLFSDIPVTPQTEAEIVVNQNTGMIQLNLDTNGDGTTDQTISPDGVEPGEPSLSQLLTLLKEKVQSLTVKDKLKQNLLKKIDNIEKKIIKKKENNTKILQKFGTKINKQEMKGKISAADANSILELVALLEAQSDTTALNLEVITELKTKINTQTVKPNVKNDLLKRIERLENKTRLITVLSNFSANIVKKGSNGKIEDADVQILLDILTQIEGVI